MTADDDNQQLTPEVQGVLADENDHDEVTRAIEAVLMVADEPVSPQLLGELLITFEGDNSKRIDLEAMQPIAVLVHAQAQAATNSLPALAFGLDIAQGADLENIRVIPTFFQSPFRK